MRIRFYQLFIIVVCASFLSCKKDNYDPPSSLFNGRLVYKGEAINVEHDRVPFEMYQYGFGKVGPINGAVTQDGKFSHMLFDGDYKFVVRPGQGPFLWPVSGGKADSITVNVRGSMTMDIEVTPYFMVRNAKTSTRGRNVTATFKAEKIITDAQAKNIERVNVYINKTQFVSGSDNISSREYANAAILDSTYNNIEFNKFIFPQSPTQNYVYVRVGIKMAGVEDLIFSPLEKIDLAPIEHYTRVEAEKSTLINSVIQDSYVSGIDNPGSGIDVNFSAPSAGTYVINVGGATEIKGSTHTIYVDGNIASSKNVIYQRQGRTAFDITPVEFNLSAGNHIISIRKNANNAGTAQLDYVDFFKVM